MRYIFAFVIPLENKKGISVTNAFNKIIKNLIENQIKYG